MIGEVTRFGIIGAGRVAHAFSTGLRTVPGAELVAVASRTAASSDTFVRRFPGTRVHATVEDLIDDRSVDVVYVASPHHLHALHSTISLIGGKAVLCEKPFTVDAAEARAVVDVARREQKFCMEAMWMRCFPLVQRAADIVRSGTIGQPRLLYADFGVPTAGLATSRFYDPQQGGGALLDRGVYAVSLATMLFGRPDDVVALAGVTPTGVDEHVGAVLRFGGGTLAVISASLTSMTSNAAMITGTEGSVVIEAPFYAPRRLSIRHSRATASDATPSRHESVAAVVKRSRLGQSMIDVIRPLVRGRASRVTQRIDGNGYGYEAAEVVRCIQSGELESPLMPLDESVTVMDVMDDIRSW